ncbi:MAG TPA: methyltransferase domain-containing protein [Verrucomicrobiae bacterium]|jgi:predicted SAM-dependent methyltransferase|nr:methyltransferase domain-containing protein [Verrucomicrobiae bacterium]
MVFLKKSNDRRLTPSSTLLNLGCGARFDARWTNVDFHSADPAVISHDLRRPLPFADAVFAAVYSSHVLEHFSRPDATAFMAECHRVLRPGGVVRVAVPDLEMIARLYLQTLEAAAAGEPGAARRHEWMTIELLDQMVREQSGGEMLAYWKRRPMPEEEFVVQRCGWEVRRFLDAYRNQPPSPPAKPPTPEQIAKFRETGENHKWMYDRVSLRALLEAAGFSDCHVCVAADSRVPGFNDYRLDLNDDGSVRKPDSLFMEGTKP